MNITININIPAIDNLATAVLALVGNKQASQEVEVKTPAPEKQKRQIKEETKSVKQADVQPEAEPEKNPVNESENTTAETTEEQYIPTVVELRAKAQEKGNTPEGKKAIKDLLDKFKSKSISNVPEESRAAFLSELEAL